PEVAIRAPDVARAVGVRVVLSKNSNGIDLAWGRRHDGQRIEQRRFIKLVKFQMQVTIRRRRDVFENALVPNVVPPRILDDVEKLDHSLPVQQNIEHPAGLAPAAEAPWSKVRFQKVEVQFVVSGTQGDVVGKISKAEVLIDLGVRGARQKLQRLNRGLTSGIV